MRRHVLCLFLLLLIAPLAVAEERFGDFSKHRAKIRIDLPEQGGFAGEVLSVKLPGFLILANGYVHLTKDENEAPDESSVNNRIEFFYLSFTSPGSSNPDLEASNFVRFNLIQGIWNPNDQLMIITIPYTIDDSEKKQMIKFSEQCTVELYARERKTNTVTMYFNPMGWPHVVKVVARCTVLESTLGYKNILK